LGVLAVAEELLDARYSNVVTVVDMLHFDPLFKVKKSDIIFLEEDYDLIIPVLNLGL
jgi:hypothetical protein